MSSEVPDTNSNDSSINTADDKDQKSNSTTPEQKQCFLQTDILKIIPSIAKHTGLSQSNVTNLAEPSFKVNDNAPSCLKSSAEYSAIGIK